MQRTSAAINSCQPRRWWISIEGTAEIKWQLQQQIKQQAMHMLLGKLPPEGKAVGVNFDSRLFRFEL